MRLGSICQLIDGTKLSGETYHNLDARYMRGKSTPNLIDSGKFVAKGTYLILVDGENSGEVFISPEDGYMGSTFKVLWFPASISEDYLLQFIGLNKEFLKNSKKGAAIPHLNKEKFFNLFFPLPPVEEQGRIVRKIRDLAPYLKKYDDVEFNLEALNSTFPERLKKSIFQEAVQGKLVPQDANDEPASALLERIHEEKEKLIKTKKIKRDKHESVIFRRGNSYYEKVDGVERCIDDEIPFEIPERWAWIRLGSIGETNIGLTYKPSDKTNAQNGIAVLRSSNIKNGKMDYGDMVYISCDIPEKAMIKKGDILMCVRNGSRALVGKSAIVDADGMAFGAFMAKYTSYLSGKFNPYILTFIESPQFRNQLIGIKTETINQITQNMLKCQLLPLPPLEEQNRIASKLNEILPIIATL